MVWRSIAVTLWCAFSVLAADPLDSWSKRTSGIGWNLHSVAHGSGRFVAVGQSGTTLVSTNGWDWETNSINTFTQALHSVAFGAGRFVAVGAEGTILSAFDGVVWTPQNSTTTNDLKGVRWMNDRFIATGARGTILSSPDGEAWTQHASGSTHTLNATAYGQGRFIIVGQGNSNPTSIVTSSDGITWSNRIENFLALYEIVFANNQFVALGVRGSLFISTNGVDWDELFNTVNSHYNFALTHVHGRFVAVGGPYGGGGQKIVSSTDAWTWRLHPVVSNHSGTLRGVAYGNGTLVAVGDKGIILQSGSFLRLSPASGTDGRSWSFVPDVGASYRFQYASNSMGGEWIDLATVPASTSPAPIVLSDTNPPVSQRFYRVISP